MGDYFATGDGNDTLKVGNGDDVVYAGVGNDVVEGGTGNRAVDAGDGNDRVTLGAGSTTIKAGSGDDTIDLVNDGNTQVVEGGPGADALTLTFRDSYSTSEYGVTLADGTAMTLNSNSSWEANATIVWENSPSATEIVNGVTVAKAQIVNGVSVSGLERLLLATGNGNDTLTNLTVNTDDVFITGAGDDTVNAGGGNDRIEGGTGNNRLGGGSGADKFVLNALAVDTITDFSKAESDQLDLATVLAQLVGYVSGNPFDTAKGYLALMQTADGVRVLVDMDGKAGAAHSFKTIATLNNLTAGAVGSAQFAQGFTPTVLLNHAPTGMDKTLSLAETATHTFAVADFGFTDPNDNPANSLLALKLSMLPSAGSLALNGAAVTAGQTVLAADIGTGKLKFTPAVKDAAYTTQLTFQVQDDGGTANGGIDIDPTPNTLSFNVTSLAKANQTITFGTAPSVIFNGTGTVSATGGASGNPVTLISQTTGVCTFGNIVNNGVSVSATVTGVAAGACTIAADQTGNASYNAATQATLNFQISLGKALSITNLNPAFGGVTGDAGGIVCGTSCNARYLDGTTVRLTAIPLPGYQFSGWGGSCLGYGNSCTLTMDTDKSVTAKFEVFNKKRRKSWRLLF
ncbi:MAG: type I secretion C-terminal target domain-containing protein [Proteobacteria bacterium]|nr:type I secretion C-terminal target domain-containing protein [Pseudomonadota bacterium]